VQAWAFAEINRGGGNIGILLIIFQVVNDAVQMDLHKTLYPLHACVTSYTQCAKRRLQKPALIKPVWSNYRPAGCMWPLQRFQWPEEEFRKKTSNFKFVEECM